MSRNILALSAALLLAPAAVGQIKADDCLVAELTGSFTSEGLYAVDVTKTTKNVRSITGHKNGNPGSVALSGMAPFDIYATGGGICAGFGMPLNHYILSGDKWSKNGAAAGCLDFQLNLVGFLRRIHVFKGQRIFTLTGAIPSTGPKPGLFLKPTTKSSTQLAAIAFAFDMAVLGNKIYVSTRPNSGKSQIVEVDMSGSKPVVKTYTLKGAAGVTAPSIVECICADGHESSATTLTLADTKGNLFRFDPSKGTGGANVTSQVGKSAPGKPVAIAWHPRAKAGYVIATNKSVYDYLNWILGVDSNGKPRGKALFTSTKTISDIATNCGGIDFYGVGCASQNGRTPVMDFGGCPSLGNNTFAGKCKNAPANASALLVGGLKKVNVTLPNGCKLQADIFLSFPTKTDNMGKASVTFGLPTLTALVGLNVYAQYAIADGSKFVVTNGAHFVLR